MSKVTPVHDQIEPARSFLDEAYVSLGYANGSLFAAGEFSTAAPREAENWLDKGDWLALAGQIGAEKVLFVNNDPVIVFCETKSVPSETVLVETYRRIWCMARPECLFLALPGELRVYSLSLPPVRDPQNWTQLKPLDIVRRTADVAEVLQKYRIEQVETGKLFADDRFGTSDQRADKRLIADLQIVRRSLLADGLKAEHVHALIGRSIFIRYLEDRGVLTPQYFQQIAASNPHWQTLLNTDPEKPNVLVGHANRRFDRVLRDKEFTYAVFNELVNSFNGDMFPRDEEEEHKVKQTHLDRLRGFLLGDTDPRQPTLFFWAYDFSVIPIELISSIYEEFYHEAVDDDKGTHYTPSSLVEYTLSQVLSRGRLTSNPRILDPACGSGIFLVEAFRRIVRYQTQSLGRTLTSEELRQILRAQISGIELNREAAHVAAFSLYLALLHYQEPPNILRTRPLPSLLYADDQPRDERHFGIIHHRNAFALTQSESHELWVRLTAQNTFANKKTLQLLLESRRRFNLRLHSFDVIVGNPPWFEIGNTLRPMSCAELPPISSVPAPFVYNSFKRTLALKKPISALKLQAAKAMLPPAYHGIVDALKEQADEHFQALLWAQAYNLPVGDNSYSQLFMHRALSLCAEGGVIGLLVHSSVLFNQRTTSIAFRKYWLSSSRLLQIVNFAQVRKLFFEKAIAPFIFACFSPTNGSQTDSRFVYTSARLTLAAEHLRSVLLSAADRRIVSQNEVQTADYLWKTYWYGSHRDAALLARLDQESRLQDCLSPLDARPGFGFQRGTSAPSETLRRLRPLNARRVVWYGPLRDEWFEQPPSGVKTQPDERYYHGQRLLVVEGIKVSYGACVRLEYGDFSFRHTLYCVPLQSLPEWQAKLIVGIFWSSLGRYRLFMTSPNWGTWHDKITANDVLQMPVRIPKEDDPIVQRIVLAVDGLRAWKPIHMNLLGDSIPVSSSVPAELIQLLDGAVFDLFQFTDAERDLVEDFVQYKFDLYRNEAKSAALAPLAHSPMILQGTLGDLSQQFDSEHQLAQYVEAFLQVWNRELAPEGEFRWCIIRPAGVPMVAAVFSTQERGDELPAMPTSAQDEWKSTLDRCSQALKYPVGSQIYVDGMVRIVTDTDIVIIKRDERRLWTRSSAFEDAEATLVQALHLQVEATLGSNK